MVGNFHGIQIFIDFMGLLIVGKFGELTRFEHLAKESLANYRSANRLLIVSTNLDGFSLANRGRFIKLSRYTAKI